MSLVIRQMNVIVVIVMLRVLGGHLASGLSVDDVHPPQVLGRHRDVVVDVARHFLHLVFFFFNMRPWLIFVENTKVFKIKKMDL